MSATGFRSEKLMYKNMHFYCLWSGLGSLRAIAIQPSVITTCMGIYIEVKGIISIEAERIEHITSTHIFAGL